VQEYCNTLVTVRAGRRRRHRRRFVVDSYVLPGLGELRLREIAVPAVDRLLTAVRSKHGVGAAKSTSTCSVLSGALALALAVRHGALPPNLVRESSLRRTGRPAKTPRALTVAETQRLREELAADPDAIRLDLPDFVDLVLGTGMRIGEACAVRPTAVDLDAATLAITATVVRVPGHGLVVQEVPESDAGRRTIALPAFVVDLLRRRCAAVLPTAEPPALFRSLQGRLRDPNNTGGDLRRALDRAVFDWVTSHVFRKTVATRLDEAGLSARQIADHLGHTRPSLTQDVYMGRRLTSPEAAAALQRTL
jgi:integrase